MIFGQFLIKENCHNCRTSDDIDTKLVPVTKLYKKNKPTSKKKKKDDGALSKKCDVLVIFPIYGQSGAIRKPDFGRIVKLKACKTYLQKLKTKLKNL